jgi:hypothetical protein
MFCNSFAQCLHKKIESSEWLEYTQANKPSGRQAFRRAFVKKQRFRSTPLWLKETQRQRSEEQESEGLPSLSWRNRDARPRNYVCGMQYAVHVYGTRTGLLQGTKLNSPEAM